MSETLREKQVRFLKQRRKLEEYAESLGYELTGGDLFRDERVHGKIGEKKGYGHPNSCHKLRLAQDYNLFLGGKWLDKTSDFEPLGIYWESLSEDSRWGGRFGDGNHFSFEHNGFR
jgi:hypothetical protein